MDLTYDRPELINKVIFRRSMSTGTWEVCPINEASYSLSDGKANKISCKKRLSSHTSSKNSNINEQRNTSHHQDTNECVLKKHSDNCKNSASETMFSPVHIDVNESISSRTRKRLKQDLLCSCMLQNESCASNQSLFL